MKPQEGSPSGGKSTVQSDPEVCCAPERIYKLGEKETGIRLQGTVQDYDCLKEECLSTGKLFEDPEFPAVDSSIFITKKPTYRYINEIEWIRPLAFRANAQFYVEGASRFDVQQGSFGNCWMVAAVANVAMRKDLLDKVIPPGQSFQENYAGIFRFRFWQNGKWVEVVIDDRLPTYDGKLIAMHSSAKNEFWSALLEKAYAKLHGSWIALTGGYNGEALTSLTGGIVQCWVMEDTPSNLFDLLLEAQERNTLFGTGISSTFDYEIDHWKTSQGLFLNHAYSITKVMYLDGEVVGRTDKIPLLRLRNPWGQAEWTGAWGESSPEWKSIPECKKKELGLVCAEDGEFWMSFEDWKKAFTDFEICYLTPSLVSAKDNCAVQKNWEANEVFGEWVVGSSAGGSPFDVDTFQYNPQYRIEFEKDSTAVVALMRLNQRTQRPNLYTDYGFQIYKLAEECDNELPKPLDMCFFEENEPLDSDDFTVNETFVQNVTSGYERRFGCRIRLQAGVYCIIPHTEISDEEAQFLLRVFSEIPNNLEEYDVQPGRCEVSCEVLQSCDLDGDEMNVRSIFRKIAGDDWEIDWRENKELLDIKLGKELSKKGFSKDACRSIVALLDADCSGKLGYYEFKAFWKNLKIWKAAYDLQCHTWDGYLEPYTLKAVLRSAGLRINNRISDLLVRRYGTDDAFIKFDDYIMIALKLNRVFAMVLDMFGKKHTQDSMLIQYTFSDTLEERASACGRTITFTVDEWIKSTLNS